MEWIDGAIVLSARPFGESASVVHLLTMEHGRHAGLTRGGRALAPTLQAGTAVRVRWRARLAEQLGSYTLEAERGLGAAILANGDRLAALAAACAAIEGALPEREPHAALYHGTRALVEALGSLDETAEPLWAAAYVRWELGLLGELGFALDFAAPANGEPVLVSPQSGRRAAATGASADDRLLRVPGFLFGAATVGRDDLLDGLKLTGHFLERHVFGALHRPLPEARAYFVERLRRRDCGPGDAPGPD